jgi:hypothetical protein
MRKSIAIAILAMAAVSLVGGMAFAEHENTSAQTQCGYASQGGNTSQATPVGTAYAGTNSSEPGTSNGTAVVGFCTASDSMPLDGVVEAKVSATCTYVVADGDPSNPPDPTTIDGYARVATPNCPNPFTGIGNSGGHHS